MKKNSIFMILIVCVMIGSIFVNGFATSNDKKDAKINGALLMPAFETGLIDDSDISGNSGNTGSNYKNSIESNFNLVECTLVVENSDIIIYSDSMSVSDDDKKYHMEIKGYAELNDFSGTIKWENKIFTLTGNLKKIVNNKTTIEWEEYGTVLFRFSDGKINMSDVGLNELNIVASGELKINNNVMMNLDKDIFNLEGYRGMLNLNTDNLLSVDGFFDKIGVKSLDYNMIFTGN